MSAINVLRVLPARIAAALVGLALLSLAGCARSEIASGSVIYNEALGTAEDRLFLLNIARASEGRPMYFTQIAKITTSGIADNSSIRARVPWPNGPNFSNKFRLWPDLNLQEGIQMDTDPLLSQDFYQGFIKPATEPEIEYHLQYGWPRQLVYTLMIQAITISATKLASIKDEVARQATNCDQPDPPSIDACQSLATDRLFKQRCPALAAHARNGLLRFENDARTPCDFLRFQTLAMKLRALRFGYVRRQGEHQELTTITEKGTLDSHGNPIGKVTYEKHFTYHDYYCPQIRGFPEHFLGGDACKPSRSWEAITRPSPDFTLVPRSAESMLMFLGEIVHAELAASATGHPWVPRIATENNQGARLLPMFLVQRNTKGGKSSVSVSLQGNQYEIPTADGGLSMTALALVAEFFGLQQSANRLPTTPSVNAIPR